MNLSKIQLFSSYNRSMSPRRLRQKSLVVLWGLAVLLGTFILFRKTPDLNIAGDSTPVLLDDEKRTLTAGSWGETTLNVPRRSLLEVNLRVLKGQPVDVMFIDRSELNSLRDNGWSKVRGNQAFKASSVGYYDKSSEVKEGSYCLVYRDASLGVLSGDPTDVAIRIFLIPL